MHSALPVTTHAAIYAQSSTYFKSRCGVVDIRLEAKAKDPKKKSEVKDSLSEDRPYRSQGQKCSRPRTKAQVISEKNIFFRRSQKKRSSKKFWLVLELRSRGFCVQAYADDLAVLVTGADML